MAAGKILGGLILVLIGLGLFADSIWNLLPGPQINRLSKFIITLTGMIPILFILLGLFIVWLEVDEVKAKKEVEKEAAKVAVQPKPAAKEEKPNVELKK